MRYLRILTFAAIVAAAPTVALAQGGGGNKQQTGQANFGNLISALNNIAVEIGELNALSNITAGNLQLVNVSDFLKGNNVEALNNALNRNKVEIAKLTNVLNNNKVLTDFLNKSNVNVSEVIAVDVLSGGNIILFYQP